jgi:hypothetical protein
VKTLRADLHVHTALSPCGDDEMSPPAIVDAALAAGLDMIAVCDHNAAGNARAVTEAAGSRLAVIAGMEITTVEEVHVVGLFPTVAAAANAADEVRRTLPTADGDYTRFFGEQYLMSADGTVYGHDAHALALATALRLDEAVSLIKRFGGLVVAAHVDRPTFGVVSQLGFFPFEAGFDAVELSRHAPAGSPAATACAEYRLPVVRSSDSHYLEDVGCVATALTLEAPTFAELVLAVAHRQGRIVADA